MDDEPAGVEDGRSRVLRVAAGLFLNPGYGSTSMRAIAQAADMKAASIYYHFPSKDALLTEILDIGMDAVGSAFDQVEATSSGLDPSTRFRAHINGHLSALFGQYAFTASHVTVFPFAPADVRAAALPRRDAYEARWSVLLHELLPQLDATQLRLTRLSLFGAMNSAVQWFDATEGSVEDLANALATTIWSGLGTVGAHV